VKVSDFGVAKALGEATGLTRTGTTVGSPAYMSPEQVRGEHVDARSDLFSLGVILYEMVLRKRPFPAETLTTLVYQILNADPFADPQAFCSLSPELVAFLKKCLVKDPAQRIPDAATFATQARALAQWEGVETTVSTIPTMPLATVQAGRLGAPPVAEPTKRKAVPWLVVAAGVVLLGLLFLLGRRSSPPPATLLLAEATPGTQEPLAAGTPELPAVLPSPTSTVAPTATPLPTPTPLPVVPAVEPTALPTPTPTPPPPVVKTYYGRHGAVFNVDPEDALVEIQGRTIGIADDWDGKGGGKVYVFPGPGTYYARLSLKGHRTVWVAIVISPSAKDENADVDWELEEL
ncbi:MAG: serine/threonine-protein kinase, partial [Thermoanaerobaculum sp.]